MLDKAMLESVVLHLIRPEDLNHHGSLFAGQMAKWLVEAGLITASRLVGKPEDVVCVQVNGLTFKKPLNNGDLIEIKSSGTSKGARRRCRRRLRRVLKKLAPFTSVLKS